MPGRNEPCPCGSGKKYKKCCANSAAEDTLAPIKADLNSAISNFEDGNFTAAVKVAQSYLQSNQQDSTAWMVLGVSLYYLADFNKAEEAFRQVIRFDNNNPDAWNNLGLVLYEQDKLSEALTSCQRALKLQANMPGALNNLGNIYRKNGNFKQAKEFYLKAIHAGMQTPESYCNLGVVQQEMGELEAAQQSYKKALNLDVNFIPAMTNLAGQLLQDGKLDEAKTWIEKAEKIQPNDVDVLCHSGLLKKAYGDYNEALSLLEKALVQDSRHLVALTAISEILLEQSKNSAAKGYLQQAIKVNGLYDVSFARVYCKYLITLKRFNEVFPIWQNLMQQHPKSRVVHSGLAEYLIAIGDYSQAESVFSECVQANGENSTILFEWAAMEEQRHDLEKAKELAEKVVKLEPKHVAAQLMLVKLLARKKEYSLAITALDRIEPTDDKLNTINLLYERATLLDKLKRYEEAYQVFTEASELKTQLTGENYNLDNERRYTEEISKVFNKENQQHIPEFIADKNESSLTPIFIVGFPRSGTTLVEQILSAHSMISAGDEISFVDEIKSQINTLTGGQQPYPFNLVDQKHELRQEHIVKLREHYFSRVQENSILQDGNTVFTDKLPHNLRNLGLITKLFPDSPIIHIVRHPIDACLSAYMANFSFESGPRYALSMHNTVVHYDVTMRLAEFYKSAIKMKYLQVRYEDIVDDPEKLSRELVDFIGLLWEEACLNFHENKRVSNSASYAQITEKIYTSSRYRYKNYYQQMTPYAKILSATMTNFGYTFEP